MANVDIRQGYKDAAWFAANPTLILKQGQKVHLEQTGTYKLGDGTTQLSALLFLGGTATSTDLIVATVVNKTGVNLLAANYQAVKISTAQGQRLAIDFAQANNDINSTDTIGLIAQNININQEALINILGQLIEINTTGSLQGETWADGDVLYLSPTVAGKVTNIKPTGLTGHLVVLGYVEYAHAVHGKIYVKITNGFELDELHNVYVNPTTLANNDVLTYDSASSLWKNKQSSLKIMHLDTIDSATLTGTTVQTLISTYSFNANDYLVGDVIQFYLRGRKVGVNSFHTVRIYYNTTNSLTGAILFHSVQVTNTNISFSHIKNGIIKSASSTEFYPQGVASDNGVNATTASTNINIDYTNVGYFIIALVNASAADSTTISLFEVQRKRL